MKPFTLIIEYMYAKISTGSIEKFEGVKTLAAAKRIHFKRYVASIKKATWYNETGLPFEIN